MPVQCQPAGSQKLMPTSCKFTWEITNFTKLTEMYYYSTPFKVGRDNWRMLLYPKGYDGMGHLSLFMGVADSANLPQGWTRFAKYSLWVVNQHNASLSVGYELSHSFCSTSTDWGIGGMATHVELSDYGFLMDDTIIVGMDINIPEVVVEERQEFTSTDKLDSYFTSLGQFISGVSAVPSVLVRSCPDGRVPTLDEVENAKRSLKECFSEPFKANMKGRLAEALSTLSRAEVGLSAGQLSSIREFWAGFEDFTLDFLSFEQTNAEFERHELLRVQMFFKLMEGHEKHIMLKRLWMEIKKEKEECERSVKDMHKIKEKLESDWNALSVELQETKSKYMEHEKKAKDAGEKKRTAEERISRPTSAWSNLKTKFT